MEAKKEGQGISMTSEYKLTAPTPNPGQRKCIDGIGTGKSSLVYDILGKDEEDAIFETLNNEIKWREMSHKRGLVPRLICNQSTVYKSTKTAEGDNDTLDLFHPVYRHEGLAAGAANPPPLISWTPYVANIKKTAEEICGHPFNHALIQLYRSGDDYINEHADKTLDIMEGSYICNYSCGALRTMILRLKKGARETANETGFAPSEKQIPAQPCISKKEQQEVDNQKEQERNKLRIPMTHNSLFLLDPHTNRYMLHSIKRDKRPNCEKTEDELKEGGARISITFRWIHTFERISDAILFGGGSKRKNIKVDEKNSIVSVIEYGDQPVKDATSKGDTNHCKDDGETMLIAFSKENSEAESFNWEEIYGCGFDAKEAPNFV